MYGICGVFIIFQVVHKNRVLWQAVSCWIIQQDCTSTINMNHHPYTKRPDLLITLAITVYMYAILCVLSRHPFESSIASTQHKETANQYNQVFINERN